jgi:hypothetical protein
LCRNAGASGSAFRLVRWPRELVEFATAIIRSQNANFPLAKEVVTPPVP